MIGELAIETLVIEEFLEFIPSLYSETLELVIESLDTGLSRTEIFELDPLELLHLLSVLNMESLGLLGRLIPKPFTLFGDVEALKLLANT